MVDIQTSKEAGERGTLSDELRRLYKTGGSGSFSSEQVWDYDRGEGDDKESINIKFVFDDHGEISSIWLNGDMIERDQLNLMATEGYINDLVYDITRMLDETRRHDLRTKRQ